MDDSWLHEECVLDSPESESDPEKEQNELEERLYAITHHSVRGEALSPEIAKHFSVHCAEDGDVVVTLKNSLEDIKNDTKLKSNYEENERLVSHCESGNRNNEEEIVHLPSGGGNDDVVLVSEVQNNKKPQNSHVTFSGINVDKSCESDVGSEIKFILNSHNTDFFKIAPQLLNLNENKRFKFFTIPSAQNSSDWKSTANLSFISIKPNDMLTKPEIIQKITNALKQVNPNNKKQKIVEFARFLYNKNLEVFRKEEKMKRNHTLRNGTLSKYDTTQNSSFKKQKNANADTQNSCINLNKHLSGQKNQHTPRWQGSISLNVSPFIPDPPTIDLISEDEKNSLISSANTVCKSSKNLQSCIPLKWTKEMINFYTKPLKTKMETNINKIIENLKKNTVAEDWWLDPRDQAGSYQRKPLNKQFMGRRCSNCEKRGHFIRDCPRPIRIPACALCGEMYHTDYSCPNKICRKCGVPITSETCDGECSTCYWSNFNYDTPCCVCGRPTHRSEICPDLWRRFHATTGPGFTIPDQIIENKRKCCANCSQKGHFSHDCPLPSYNGEQPSPFVTNYSNGPLEIGTAEMWFDSDSAIYLQGHESDMFLQDLSNTTSTEIECNDMNSSMMVHIRGTFPKCKKVQNQIESYINIRKRKRQEPYLKKKKRRLR